MLNARLRKSGPGLSLVLAGALGVIIGAALLVVARTHVISLRYELADSLAREAALIDEIEKLRVEAAALVSPERLLPAARELGLDYPEPGQILNLRGPEPTDVAAGGRP